MIKFILPLIVGLITFIIVFITAPVHAQIDTINTEQVKVRVIHSTHIVPMGADWTSIIPQGFVIAPVDRTCADLIAESEAKMHEREDILAIEHERTDWVHKSTAQCMTINFMRPRLVDVVSQSFSCVRVYSVNMEWVFTCQEN